MSAPGVMLSLGLFLVALLVAVVGGLGSGSVLAALIALVAAGIAGWGVWKGVQSERQTGMALSIVLLLLNLSLAGLTLVLKLIDAF